MFRIYWRAGYDMAIEDLQLWDFIFTEYGIDNQTINFMMILPPVYLVDVPTRSSRLHIDIAEDFDVS